MLAVWPPRPCTDTIPQVPPEGQYEPGSQRKQRHAGADDGPWENIPAPVISDAERAQMLAELARDRDGGGARVRPPTPEELSD
jgi:hypothetical protein